MFCLISCNKDFLKDYDTEELFATPTTAELNDVLTDWQSRDLSPSNYTEEAVYPVGGNAVLKMVSFNVSGNKEYGALLIPPSVEGMPVRMWIGGFGYDVTMNSINIVFDTTASDHPFIFAVPALRGQWLSVRVNGIEYTSPVSEGNHCDAFDGATDDAIAFLNIIDSTEVKSDINRTGVRGGSRGATVAMLMAERDERVKLAVSVAGPVNMIELTSKSENDETYQCQFLDDLVNGNETIDQARHKMIASSPYFFSEYLPPTQLHLAAKDDIVPVSEGEDLNEKMNESGLGGPLELFIYEGRDHSNIATNNSELEERIQSFFSQL